MDSRIRVEKAGENDCQSVTFADVFSGGGSDSQPDWRRRIGGRSVDRQDRIVFFGIYNFHGWLQSAVGGWQMAHRSTVGGGRNFGTGVNFGGSRSISIVWIGRLHQGFYSGGRADRGVSGGVGGAGDRAGGTEGQRPRAKGQRPYG